MTDGEPPQPLDYEPPPGRHGHRWAIRAAVCLSAAAIGLILLALTALQPRNGSSYSPRAACASNDHQIGLAILLYQQDTGDHYPATLGALLSGGGKGDTQAPSRPL